MNIPPTRVIVSERERLEALGLIERALVWGRLAQGELVERFEQEFAGAHGGGAECVATSSGTSALEAVFRALQVYGREVVVPTNTFYATAAAVVHAGGSPVLCDVDPRDGTATPEAVGKVMTTKTVAVAYVHIGGLVSPNVVGVAELCRRLGLPLVEDCAHAHGCAFDGTPAGLFGTAGCFSFFATKVVTSGEGGAVLTHDRRLAERVRSLRDHGKSPDDPCLHVLPGSNWRMSEVHAALGLAQVRKMHLAVAERLAAVDRYRNHTAAWEWLRPVLPHLRCRENGYKMLCLLEGGVNRDGLVMDLARHGVRVAGGVFDRPLHRQPVMAPFPRQDSFPGADEFCGRQLCLPVYRGMGADHVAHVVDALKKCHGMA
jgi:perosamine synthetase